MGMGPLHLYTTSPAEAEAQQMQQYQQQFSQSAAAPIPGTWNGRPIPQTPTGSVPSGMHPSQQNAQGLLNGVLSQYMNNSYTPEQWRGLLPAGAGNQVPQVAPQPFAAAGPYGGQAARMAGLLPAPAPNDTYPHGLLGGKRGSFRPGGK